MPQKQPESNSEKTSQRQSRLKKRLNEINDRTERELALIKQNIEKAKASFRLKS